MIRLQDKSSEIGSTLIDLEFVDIYPEYSARIEHDVVTFYRCGMIEAQFPRGCYGVQDDTQWARSLLNQWADSGEAILLDIDVMERSR